MPCFEKSTGSGRGISRGEIMSGGAGETSDNSVELMLLVNSESLGKVSTLLDLPGEVCRVSHVKSPSALGPRKQP